MDSVYQRQFGMRKITSATPFSSAPSPAISSSPMQTRPRIQWNSQSRGSRGMAGVQSRNTISKDRIQGEEQRMAGLLAQHGNKVMRTQYTALSVEPIDSVSNDEAAHSDAADGDATDSDVAYGSSADSDDIREQRANYYQMGALIQEISDDLHSTWSPLIRNYVESPPKSAKRRDEEHRKLSEAVMQHIILKLDGVKTGGVEIRQRRKDLVQQATALLRQLDSAKAS